MGLLLLEAFGALGVLVLIVWWTMFSGRRKGEMPKPDDGKADGAEAGGTNDGTNGKP